MFKSAVIDRRYTRSVAASDSPLLFCVSFVTHPSFLVLDLSIGERERRFSFF
jgi:hypothetical protein